MTDTMKNQPLQTLKGFRDFLPEEKRRRDAVVEKIRQVFECYGFQPLETPALEYADLLLGKYGEEADKLIYSFEDRGGRKIALKYDQTVPTARVMAQYPEIPKPFKRYQIQPVWRAEKPQRGRYREFLQCDADILGPKSYVADAEILTLFGKCLEALGIDYELRVNSREMLYSLLKGIASNDSWPTILRAIDKLDKKSKTEVMAELETKGITKEQIGLIFSRLENTKLADDKWLNYVVQIATNDFGLPKSRVAFAPQLVRGLDYYTGVIFEAVVKNETIGSVGGGGRYDNLIEQLSGNKIEAVGFALGLDRIMEIVDIKISPTATKVLITTLPDNQTESKVNADAFRLVAKIRDAQIPAEINLDMKADLGKQLKYANQKQIPFTILITETNVNQDAILLKDMTTGTQATLPLDQVITRLRS